mgnify:CR=1 FL=1|tara:strand:+ start:3667 stop:7311 length:3645 start_codon:yes stop_codon:yes gene_type:complete
MAGIDLSTLVFHEGEKQEDTTITPEVVEKQSEETEDITIPKITQEDIDSGIDIFASEEESDTNPPIYDEPVGQTTIEDAFDALLTRQTDLPVDERKRTLSREIFAAEEAMIDPRLSITNREAELLLPPTEKMAKRADMTLAEVLNDMRTEEFKKLEDDLEYQQAIENQIKEQVEYYDNVTKFGGSGENIPDKEQIREEVLQDNENVIKLQFETADYYLNNRNTYMRKAAQQLFFAVERDYLSIEGFNAIMVADEFLNPVNAAFEVPHHWAAMQEHVKEGNYGAATKEALMATLNLASAIPLAKVATKGINKGWRALSGGRGAYHDVQEAMTNEGLRAYDIKQLAKKTANENADIRNKIIREFEEQFNVTISTELPNGNLAVDPTLVRETGKTKLNEYMTDMGYVGTNGETVKLTDYAINDESLAIPILDPDKMNMFVSTVVGLKSNPKFAAALETTGDERLVDKLFELTMNKELLGSEELLEQLTKNGLAFEEYVLGVVGSGSQAGKLLNQLSQIKRIKPASVKEAQETKARVETQKAFGRLWTGTVLRTENVRRGMMVSSLATTMRNLQSGLIRAPMESLADVLDTALLTYGNARMAGASTPKALLKFHNSINPLVRDGTWSGSFNNLRYLFMDQSRAEDFTNYILDRPELTEQFEKMFHNINEIQEYTGRGKAQTLVGKGADNVMSRIEDVVWTVNGPNRWQEHVIRRATFMSDLERQVKTNWGIDLQTALKEGKIDAILKDAPSVRPEGGSSFLDMVEKSTQKALDVTYAKQPDFAPFKAISDGITKSGLTVIIPFPRFMFNSLEYMAQNTAGAMLVPIRKAISKESRAAGLTARDRQDISRNLVGLATMKTFYEMREAGFGTEDYTMVTDGENQVDISAQFPLRQMAWITEFYSRGGLSSIGLEGDEDTIDTWYGMDMKEITETFLGSTLRTGTGNVFVDEITDIIKGTEDIIDEEKRSKTIGRLVGQYTATFLTPVFQLTEAQRGQDVRTSEAKDFKGSITSDTNLPFGENAMVRSFYEVYAQRGLAAPSFEEDLPQRVRIDGKKLQRPDAPSRLFLGLTVTERDSETISYLKDVGFADPTYQLGSRSRIPANKLAENEFISAALPTMVDIVQELAKDMHPDDKKKQNIFARKGVSQAARSLREEFNDPRYGGASEVAIVVDTLSRLNKDDRKYGIVMFKDNNDGRLPDIRSLEDMMEYAEYCKIKYFN